MADRKETQKLLDAQPRPKSLRVQLNDALAELAEERELRHVAERDRDLWHGVATRKSDKILTAIGDGEPVPLEVAAGHLQIVAALARQWITEAPRFMELTLEDTEGQMLLTVKKAEQPSPIQLLKEAESELARLREALEFYAAAETWERIDGSIDALYTDQFDAFDCSPMDVGIDGESLAVPGKRAREALGK